MTSAAPVVLKFTDTCWDLVLLKPRMVRLGPCMVMYISAVLTAVTCSPCHHRGVMVTAAPDAEVA